MAKGKLPPKKSVGKNTEKILKQAKKTAAKETTTKGKSKNHVDAVKKSKVPKPSQNQRGRIPTKGDSDLTR